MQAGFGHYKGSTDACPAVSRVVVELRSPSASDNGVAKAFLPVGTLEVDLIQPLVSNSPPLHSIPCSDIVSVWRQCRPSRGHDSVTGASDALREVRRVPFRRLGMAVIGPKHLSASQRTHLSQVGDPSCDLAPVARHCVLQRVPLIVTL